MCRQSVWVNVRAGKLQLRSLIFVEMLSNLNKPARGELTALRDLLSNAYLYILFSLSLLFFHFETLLTSCVCSKA